MITHTILLNHGKFILSAGFLSYLQGLGFLRAGLSKRVGYLIYKGTKTKGLAMKNK